jgi:aspartate kinase
MSGYVRTKSRSKPEETTLQLVVQKFGGTSVANPQRILEAARKAIKASNAGKQVLVVVSARGDKTDELIELAQQINDNPPPREMDMLLSTGEQESIALLAMAVHTLGGEAVSFTGAQIGIMTDSVHGKARIKAINTERMRKALTEGKIVIVAGFQGHDDEANITTLGRGGSDTTAVALAAVMKHDPATTNNGIPEINCEIYTDVDGIYTTDPRIVPDARKLIAISYDEMLELASAGAAVMHSRSIEFAKKFDVPVHVRSSFSDVEGTWIIPEAEWMRREPVVGCALMKDEARVAILGVPDTPGISHRVFEAVAARNIVVDMIAQNVGTAGRADIGFTVPAGEVRATLAALEPLAREWGARVEYDSEVSKVSIVGVGMRTHAGVAERMFAALAAEGINLKMITTADIKISALVEKAEGLRALRAVHQAFKLAQAPSGVVATVQPPVTTHRDLAGLTRQLSDMEGILVSGLELEMDQARVTLTGLPDEPGSCFHIFQAIASAGIVVDMIVQNLSAGQPELSFSVPRDDLDRAIELTRQAARIINPAAQVAGDASIAIVHVGGVGMRTHTGVARQMFGALASRGINVVMINTSEVRLSVVVDYTRGEEALACLQEVFRL